MASDVAALNDAPTAATLQEMVDEPETGEDGEDDSLVFDLSSYLVEPPLSS